MNPIKIEYKSPGSLKPNPWNSNVVSPEMEERLRASIAKFGLYKPIITRLLPNGDEQILGGEHRWRCAVDMQLEQVPVVCLGQLDDKHAKLLGLADNGSYGVDDVARLDAILREIGMDEVAEVLPYSDSELAGMFQSAADIDLTSIGFDEDIADQVSADTLPAERPVKLTELMRFKVPVEDREMVERLLKKVIKTHGFDKEEDSLVAAGLALVELANIGKAGYEA